MAVATPTPVSLPKIRGEDFSVDNWSRQVFKNLSGMYESGEFCDLVLQFTNLQVLNVHRVVVGACTDYFRNLERMYGLTDGKLLVPKDVCFDTASIIIKFFYTGKMEVRTDQFNDVFRTVKLMNVNLLTRLLEAHLRKPILQNNQESNHRVVIQNRATVTVQQAPGIPGLKIVKTPARKTGTTRVKTKTILARVQTQSQAKRLQLQAKV
jgi:hypothetical protein